MIPFFILKEFAQKYVIISRTVVLLPKIYLVGEITRLVIEISRYENYFSKPHIKRRNGYANDTLTETTKTRPQMAENCVNKLSGSYFA
jgi:hypothetical protein